MECCLPLPDRIGPSLAAIKDELERGNIKTVSIVAHGSRDILEALASSVDEVDFSGFPFPVAQAELVVRAGCSSSDYIAEVCDVLIGRINRHLCLLFGAARDPDTGDLAIHMHGFVARHTDGKLYFEHEKVTLPRFTIAMPTDVGRLSERVRVLLGRRYERDERFLSDRELDASTTPRFRFGMTGDDFVRILSAIVDVKFPSDAVALVSRVPGETLVAIERAGPDDDEGQLSRHDLQTALHLVIRHYCGDSPPTPQVVFPRGLVRVGGLYRDCVGIAPRGVVRCLVVRPSPPSALSRARALCDYEAAMARIATEDNDLATDLRILLDDPDT